MATYNLLNPDPHYQIDSPYKWAQDLREKHSKMIWFQDQVDHTKTKQEFYSMPPEVQESFMRILQFFTQGDVKVCDNYTDNLIQIFRGNEVRGMLISFADREVTHVRAYSSLIETLNLPKERLENFFTEYMEVKEMRDKNDYLNEHSLQRIVKNSDISNLSVVEKKEIVKNIACFGGFSEGTQLYSSFAMLFEPGRGINGGILQSVSNIVEWSTKDESLHSESMLKLLNVLVQENPETWTEDLKKEIYTICGTVVHFEDAFIDYVFKPCGGGFMNITAEGVKQYIRYVADLRLKQMGLKPMFKHPKNPLPHMDELLSVGISNFFETTPADYSHAATKGNWGECTFD